MAARDDLGGGVETRRVKRTPTDGGFSERIVGAVLFAVVLLGTLVWGALPFTFAIALAAIIGSVELFSMFETKGRLRPRQPS